MNNFKYLILMTLCIVSISCENSDVRKGRKLYIEYIKEFLTDPESFKIYEEKILLKKPRNIIFLVDYGAKNSLGGMVRMRKKIEILGEEIFKINDKSPAYDLLAMATGSGTSYYSEQNNAQNQQEKIEYPDIYEKYKNITPLPPIPMVQIIDESVVGQIKTISKNIWAAKGEDDFKEADMAFRKYNRETFNEKFYLSYLFDLEEGDRVKILKITHTYCNVEVMSGKQKGETLYIYNRGFLK